MNLIGHYIHQIKDLKSDSLKRHPARSHLSTPDSGTYSTKRLSTLPSSMLFSFLASATLKNVGKSLLRERFLEKRTMSRGYSLKTTLLRSHYQFPREEDSVKR